MVPREPLTIVNNSCCAHATGNEILALLKTIFIYFAYLFSFVCVTVNARLRGPLVGVNSCLPHVGPRGYTYAPPCLVYLLVSGMLDIKPRVLCLLGKQSPTETYPQPLSFVSLYFEAGAC